MAKIKFAFDRKKAIEVILYLIPRIKSADIYGLCKLLYLVDKTSLEKYGRFLFGETYCAMKEGPTPSYTYDLLKGVAEMQSEDFFVQGNQVIARRAYDPAWLSKSDIECLDEIINIYGNVPNWKRRADTHDEAWEKNWNKRGEKRSVTIPVEDIVELLEDPEELLAHLKHDD